MATTKTAAKKEASKSKTTGKADVWKDSAEEYARRYRPRTLSEVVGQTMAKYTIRGFIRKKQTPGATLFSGPFGNGKTTMARILAMSVNCKSLVDGDPCMTCPSCKLMLAGKNPDYIEVNASDSRGIDDARDLIRRAQFKPMFNRLVILLDEVHEMTSNGLEAVLKILEEPKSHVMFMLATTEPQKLKNTILSRCIQVRITDMESSTVIKLMRRVCKAEKINVPDEVLSLIANKCGCHVRDCLKMLEIVTNAIDDGALKNVDLSHVEAHVSSLLGVPNYELVQSFLANVYANKPADAIRYAASCSMPKPLFLRAAIEVHGNVMLALALPEPKAVIRDGYVLRYTSSVISAGRLSASTDVMATMRTMAIDMADWFGRSGNFQFNDSGIALTSIAIHNAPRFKAAKGK